MPSKLIPPPILTCSFICLHVTLLYVYLVMCIFWSYRNQDEITVGHSAENRRCGTRYKEVLKDEEIVSIPVLESLAQMLDVDSILEEVIFLLMNYVFDIHNKDILPQSQ